MAGQSVAFAAGDGEDGERTSRISDASVPEIKADPRMRRPDPLIELGNPFLGSGNIEPGLELPGGAVIQPTFIVYGTYRTAIQAFDNGTDTNSEWVNRLDIFGNLQLTGTERIVVGMQPLNSESRFTGYYFTPDGSDGFHDEFNADITTLFMEGDLGEIFQDADPYDSHALDFGFSVGRQPLSYQEGMLINDDMDAVGITRNTLLPDGGTDLQITGVYAWNDIHRDDNIEDTDTHLFGLFVAADYPKSTYAFDFVYVADERDVNSGAFWGASAVQRIGHYNTSFRVLGSHRTANENASVSSGYLLFGEVSWTPAWTHDNVYVNGFVGIDNFSSAARGPTAGGPLGRTGILFAAVGIGRYGAALGNRADDLVGAAVGYQMFLDDQARRQLVFEAGGTQSTINNGDYNLAAGVRYQQAIGQHTVLQGDIFGGIPESANETWGARLELSFTF